MYKLEFELEQHTPIIHFQARDAGATLRASEVKPKLDKFILTQIGKRFIKRSDSITEKNFIERGIEYFQNKDAEARRVYEEEKKKGNKDAKLELCLIPGQEGALNYKLSFKLSPDAKVQYFLPMSSNPKGTGKLKSLVQEKLGVQEVEILPLTSYFANEDKAKSEPNIKHGDTPGQIKNKKRIFEENWQKVQLATLVNTPVKGIIHFQDAGLREEVNNLISDFFMLHNFGARQSKGFGSFIISQRDGKEVEDYFDTGCACYGYSFYIPAKTPQEALRKINYFYKSLRSGFNEYRGKNEIFYAKSGMHFYATKHNFEWDKRSIKGVLFNQDQDLKEKMQNEQLFAFRDLLGLSPVERWQSQKTTITKECRNKNGKKFDRIKSPLQFKPICYSKYDYIVFFDLFPEKSGIHQLKGGKIVVKSSRHKGAILGLKIQEDIDLYNVFNEIFSELNFESQVAEYDSLTDAREIYETLDDIYEQLNKNCHE
ncbi:hypothetical protein [Porphyromonas gulae]|uniref:Uncharacterized protein n=1 Tax=Porphyromonas gulae TaxID=111105 RepID=A0A0A2F333_9PORP|nr:hypothetical protein [Porphyromonas gulae]KGN85436.1 hypothetical protein HR08_05950 [Porphyromonas gulae]KGO02653.1 hypothetical protein HQ42_06505 [Porphyromonas gulae]